MNNIKFPYYPSDIKITKPLGYVTLEDFVRANKNPNDKMKDLFVRIQKASALGDLKTKAELKSQLFYFNPCVTTDGLGRKYDNITSFTGLCVLDFDKISFAKELKHEIFNKLPSCVCAFLSSSGFGCKFIVRIPRVYSVDEFKSYFYGLSYFFEHISGFDGSSQNPCLPLYMCWDEDFLYRPNAEVWDIRGDKIYGWNKKGEIVNTEDINPTEDDRQFVINIVCKKIREIEDNGHPQVRSVALLLGGYIASGYICYDDAVELIENMIDENEYLQKNLIGYKKTARQMINKGMEKPLELSKND